MNSIMRSNYLLYLALYTSKFMSKFSRYPDDLTQLSPITYLIINYHISIVNIQTTVCYCKKFYSLNEDPIVNGKYNYKTNNS